VPAVMDRGKTPRGLTRREFLYRSAYELGRHLQGYEIAKILAAVDILEARAAPTGGRIGLVGWGEGGLLALHASALDPRISSALVSGYFGPREEMWREPLDRNVFDYLDEFGGAEVAALSAPRTLVLEAAEAPAFEVPPGTGGGPGRISTASLESVLAEAARASALVRAVHPGWSPRVVPSVGGSGPRGVDAAFEAFLEGLGVSPRPERSRGEAPKRLVEDLGEGARAALQFEELDRHDQELLSASAEVRKAFLARLDTSSLERFESTVEEYRRYFREETIGCFERELAPPRPRARRIFDGSRWTGYEVILDVFPGVPVPGILVVPRAIGPGDRWPAVVCQHGLEGRPRDVADPTVENPAYGQFALRLAERGYVTFAPQNPYIIGDRFRSLQRKANPLGKTLFSLIVPAHEQIVRWLGSLPFVDPARIGFYGLSYGGKTAMRVPPLVRGYALSICSADFNDWIWKNASTRSPYSYVWTGEYEIFEFDLGSTFNYAEMAALIAPRPFMVERGHFDGVAPDETVAAEFAKVRHLYAARLRLPPECCQIEWFVGPHQIHGAGTYEFLHRHLDWPRR